MDETSIPRNRANTWLSRGRLGTDLPLAFDHPLERDCGDCYKCVELCPAGAIEADPSGFDHIKCYEQLGQFKKGLNLGHYICGVCVKACHPTAIEK